MLSFHWLNLKEVSTYVSIAPMYNCAQESQKKLFISQNMLQHICVLAAKLTRSAMYSVTEASSIVVSYFFTGSPTLKSRHPELMMKR